MSEASPAVTATEKKPGLVWFGTVLCWSLSMIASFASAPSYEVPVAIALVTALLFFCCAYWLGQRTTLPGRLVLLVLAPLLGVVTLDNLGRALHMLGGPLVRVFV